MICNEEFLNRIKCITNEFVQLEKQMIDSRFKLIPNYEGKKIHPKATRKNEKFNYLIYLGFVTIVDLWNVSNWLLYTISQKKILLNTFMSKQQFSIHIIISIVWWKLSSFILWKFHNSCPKITTKHDWKQGHRFSCSKEVKKNKQSKELFIEFSFCHQFRVFFPLQKEQCIGNVGDWSISEKGNLDPNLQWWFCFCNHHVIYSESFVLIKVDNGKLHTKTNNSACQTGLITKSVTLKFIRISSSYCRDYCQFHFILITFTIQYVFSFGLDLFSVFRETKSSVFPTPI